MKFDLIQYMSQRYVSGSEPQVAKPVVTISRQFGCSAKEIAKLLAETIAKKYPKAEEWRWVNKEIFEGVAGKLNVSTDHVLHVFEGAKRELVWSFFRSFTEKYYTSDASIKKTLMGFIRSIAAEGNKIFIGLGSAALLQSIPKSLHVRIVAPEAWRLRAFSATAHVSQQEAKEYLQTVDEKRRKLRDSFSANSLGEFAFDVTFNRANMSKEEIVEAIIVLMLEREML